MEEISINGNTRLQPTHFFVHKGKNYPFNMKLFKCFSQYFQINKNRYKGTTYINIFDNPEEEMDLTESTINDFINFCQSKNVTLTKENSPFLHRLAKKFIVPLLIDSTQDFIQVHQKEVVVELLILNLKENNPDTTKYEQIISNDLPYFINDINLLSLPIPVLYRILTKYQQKNSEQQNNEQNSTQIVEFLFKCLDKYGRGASILFEKIDICNSKSNALNRLLFEYSDKFDFHFINSQMLKNAYELESEMIRRTEKMSSENLQHKKEIESLIQKIGEKNKEKDDQIQQKNKEIERMNLQQTEKDKLIDGLIQKHEENVQKIKKDFKSKVDSLTETVRQLNEKVAQQGGLIEQLKQKLDEENVQKIKKDFKSKVDSLTETVRQLNEKVAQQGGLIEQSKKKLDEKKKPKQSLTKHFQSESDPSGIISILGDSVTVTCGASDCSSYPISSIKKNDDSRFINKNYSKPQSESDTFIIFDFGQSKKIDLHSYFIRSAGYYSKTWRIEGSNDASQWKRLDRKVNNQSLQNNSNHQSHFQCNEAKNENDCRYRFIRYVQEDSWYSGDPYRVYFKYFELYGEIYNY